MPFRDAQRRIIEEYDDGLMGVSAVPGSGKTYTLSHLAARLVQRLSETSPNQEVLIVTFSNSAVNSFKKRIADILQFERRLLPYVGYRVRTLHGLAHDIVRERPSLVGLADDFQIVDDRTAANIRRDIVMAHLPAWRGVMERYVNRDLSEKQIKGVLARDFPELFTNIVDRFIGHAKDNQVTPDQLEQRLEGFESETFELARFATVVYGDYQRSLAFRGAVDFSDLIHLALEAVQRDPLFLARLQSRWAYILEDEAQDSSALQEQMLRLLSRGKNWVRVGDPNQAINTTFTTSNPRFLSQFLDSEQVLDRPLPHSGRSSRKIIKAANELVRWTMAEHPLAESRAVFYEQDILPTEPGDTQQNPSDANSTIHIHYQPGKMVTPDDELQIVMRSVKNFIEQSPGKTVAVLVPENNRGFKLAEILRRENVPYEELLRSTTSTRVAAAYLRSILLYLSTPYDAQALARLYRDVWWQLTFANDETRDVAIPFQALGKHRQLEALIYPVEGSAVELPFGDDTELADNVERFLQHVRRWLSALALPIDQLVLTVSQDIFHEPPDIALAYRLAVLLRSFAEENPSWGIGQFAEELRVITDNERRFIGFDDAASGFEPAPGKVTIATMHAAKGLEWDRVYLMSINNYSFPSLIASDNYAGQRWFVRDELNLEADVLAQLYALIKDMPYSEANATRTAFFEYAAERLRLLYVGITRAKSDLIITWNAGRSWERGTVANLALPVIYLHSWLAG